MIKSAIILAAGKQTRMGDYDKPKCFYEIDGIPNIENTIRCLENRVENIYITVQKGEEHHFGHLSFNDKVIVQIIPIESGYGDGDALLETLVFLETGLDTSEKCFLIWGDVYIPDERIFDEMLEYTHYEILVPTVREKNPYVSIEKDRAYFRKRGESVEEGNHDQSVFIINLSQIYKTLSLFRDFIWNGERYITENKEMNFLDIIPFLWRNSTYTNPTKIYETKYPTYGYNTIEEAENLKGNIQ